MRMLPELTLIPAVLLGLSVCAGPRVEHHPTVHADRVDHREFADCPRLRAGSTELIVVPQWAGRISRLDFGSGNVLHTNPRIDGKVLAADQGWMRWDGNATDIVRADGKHQWPGLWLHPWPDHEMTDAGIVRIISADAAEAGLQAKRSYRLTADGRMLHYTFAITRTADDQQAWTVWERAVVPAKGYILAPLNAGAEPWSRGWKPRDEATAASLHDHVQTQEDLLILRGQTARGMGVAARLAEGWIAHVTDSGVFVITWPLSPQGNYVHDDGANAVFWLAADFVELEPLSPQISLKPGQNYEFQQTWHWYDDPPTDATANPQGMAQWIRERASHAEVLD